MPATFVAERKTFAEHANALTHPVVPTANLAAGNLAVLVFGALQNPTFSIADDAGNTWAFAAQVANATSNKVGIAWSLLANALTTSNTVTVTTGLSEYAMGVLWEYSGVATVSPADQTATNTGTGFAMNSAATSTLSQADELVVAGYIVPSLVTGSTLIANDAGFDNPTPGDVMLTGDNAGTFYRSTGGVYGNVSATTAVTVTATQNVTNTGGWAACAVTFKAGPVTPGNRLRRWRI